MNVTHPPHLPELGQHHHDGRVVLPQHPPEVLHSLAEGSLCRDVGIPKNVTLLYQLNIFMYTVNINPITPTNYVSVHWYL